MAAPQLLHCLDLHGAIVNGDAMHPQRELSLQIVAAGGDFLWTVKGNQPKTEWAIHKLFVDEVVKLQKASPRRLLRLIRDDWGIENGLHYRRDVTLHEDATRATVGHTGHNLAIINNRVIALVLGAGHANLAQARRRFAAKPEDALSLITRSQVSTLRIALAWGPNPFLKIPTSATINLRPGLPAAKSFMGNRIIAVSPIHMEAVVERA